MSRCTEYGKGSDWRQTNFKEFRANHDNINWPSKAMSNVKKTNKSNDKKNRKDHSTVNSIRVRN